MDKKGFANSVIALIIVIVTAALILGFFSSITSSSNTFFGLFSSDDEENQDPDLVENIPQKMMETFLDSYNSCKNYLSDACLCSQFDTGILEGHHIKLENLKDQKTRISIYADKPTPEIPSTIIENDDICFYKFDSERESYYKAEAKEIILDPEKYYNDYTYRKKVQLFKLDSRNTCFVEKTSDREGFGKAARKEVKCSLKDEKGTDEGIKLALLDPGDSDNLADFAGDQKTAQIIVYLEDRLENIGKVSRILRGSSTEKMIIDRRKEMFSSLYDNEGGEEKSIKDKAYLISIATKDKKQEDSAIKQDHIILHYIKGSLKSRALAESIKNQLETIYGRLYKDGREYNKAEIDEKYRLNTKVLFEENDASKPGPIFLLYTSGNYDVNYAPWSYSWKEKEEIPAVFIDLVEYEEDGYNLFEGHYGVLAEKIYEGAEEFLGLKSYDGVQRRKEIEEARKLIEERENILSFKEQYLSLKESFEKYDKTEYDVPCIAGVFLDIKVPEDYQMVIDVNIETEGVIDLTKMVLALTEYPQGNEDLVEIMKEANKKHLSNFLIKLNENSEYNRDYISKLFVKYEIEGEFEESLQELSEILITEQPYYLELNKLLEFSKTIPRNEQALKDLAKDLGITQIKFTEDPESKIYYSGADGLRTLHLPEPLDHMNFILSKSIDEFEEINPKILLTNEKILVSLYSDDEAMLEKNLEDTSLMLVFYEDNYYFSVDDTKDPIKPFCYPVIQQG